MLLQRYSLLNVVLPIARLKRLRRFIFAKRARAHYVFLSTNAVHELRRRRCLWSLIWIFRGLFCRISNTWINYWRI